MQVGRALLSSPGSYHLPPGLLSALCVLVFVFEVRPSHSVQWHNQLLISGPTAAAVTEYLPVFQRITAPVARCLGQPQDGTVSVNKHTPALTDRKLARNKVGVLSSTYLRLGRQQLKQKAMMSQCFVTNCCSEIPCTVWFDFI